MLHGMFNLLKDFVEIELADMNQWNLGDDDERLGEGREEGLNCLNWQGALVNDTNSGCDSDHKLYGKPTKQAIAAKEIKELYLWWEDTRPSRPDQWADIVDDMIENGTDLFSDITLSAAKKKERSVAYKKATKLEKQYRTEDDTMLIRLVKIRSALWT